MYLYEWHLGALYLSDYEIPSDQLYCETCGDSDRLLGEVSSFEDVKRLVTDEDGGCTWSIDMLQKIKKDLEEGNVIWGDEE